MNGADIVAKWETRLKQLEQLHAHVDGAVLCREVLQDFAALRAAADDEALSLREAAAVSGYSEDHLGRLIRAGTIPNAGRLGAPRVLRRSLPLRPKAAVARSASDVYDPVTDARKLVSRRRGGAHGTS